MVNAPSHDSPAASRPCATGLVASALLVISVHYAMAAGTVPASSDREDVSGTFTRNEDDELLAINLIDAADAELDGPGELVFAGAIFGGPLAVTENDGFVSALVARANGSTGEVSADYTAIPEGSATGSATVGVDFAATSGTVTWADGDALPKHINVEIFDDAAVESSEFFRIRLSNPTGGVTIRTRDEIVLIDDNDPSAPTLSLNKSIVAGCQSVTGRLQLASPAPAGGRVISISDTLPSATTPASVTVPAGSTTITFPIKTTPVTSLQSGTITATFGGTVLTRKLSVRRIGMLSVELDRTTVVGTKPVTATAKLECKAAPEPITVDLASSNAAIADPVAASIVVPQGLQSVPFDVATNKVLSRRTVSISGTANGIKKSKTLTVTPASFVSPTSLTFGTVPVGATGGPRAVTLTNKGKISFTIGSIGITGTNPLSFAMTENCPATLAAGASCSVNVTFTPHVAQSRVAQLNIATSARAVPLIVSLTGTGT